MIELIIPCSPEQEEVIADHLFLGYALGMQPDERAWIIAHIVKQQPTGRVTSADLNIADATWTVQVSLGHK